MGGRQSRHRLEHELALARDQAASVERKHADEVAALERAKRELELTIDALQALTAQAQLEAAQATLAARESDDRMRALKWELVRKLTVATASSSPTALSPTASPSESGGATLAASESGSPRVALTWKLRDGVTLRRASTAMLSVSRSTLGSSGNVDATQQRPHAQSEPVMLKPQMQQPKQQAVTLTAVVVADTKAASAKTNARPSARSSIDTSRSSSSESESESEHKAATAVQSLTRSNASSSEDEARKPASKFPPLSRKASTRASVVTAKQRDDEAETNATRAFDSDVLVFSSDDDASS